ncbi:hypothetical protein SAMN02745866_01967 [Alteromonadaceae bacterium Bs31]|nr:hypothetical protein SAMN02745866_01967 [Alteromonadaceae bacterium Bs31]
MSDLYRCKHTLVKLVVIVTVAALAACGGGSNGPKTTPTPIPDTTPNSFTFTAQTDQPVSTQVESNAVTIAGINQAVAISVEGGEYSIADADFTAAAGTIRSGQTLVLRGLSSSEFETESTVTVRISSVSRSFSITTAVQDVTPNEFDLGITTNAALGSEVLSAGFPVRGITGAVPVSILGGTYTIDGGTPTSEAGTIEAEQEIQVQVQAAPGFLAEVVATLTVGDFTETFSVTTREPNLTPDDFTFDAELDANLAEDYTSNTITVAGIEAPVSLSVSAGTYLINGSVSTATTISAGDTLAVVLSSSAELETPVSSTVTIGGLAADYTVTTFADTTAPTAAVAFPPPVSKTDNTSVMVRGTAEDDYNSISSIRIFVNDADSGVTVETTDNYANWQVQLPLVEGDNNIDIVTTDSEGNEDTEAAALFVRKEVYHKAFPSAISEDSLRALTDGFIEVTETEARAYFISHGYAIQDFLVELDLNTGLSTRHSISGLPSGDNVKLFYNVAFDAATNQLFTWGYDLEDGQIIVIDRATWMVVRSFTGEGLVAGSPLIVDRSVNPPRLLFKNDSEGIDQMGLALGSYSDFSTTSTPNSDTPFASPPRTIVKDPDADRLIVTTDSTGVFSVDLATGARNVLSELDDAIGDAVGIDIAQYDISCALDKSVIVGRYLCVAEESILIAIDLVSGERTVFAAADTNMPERILSMISSEYLGYVLVFGSGGDQTVQAVDLVSGQRVTIARSFDGIPLID